MILLLALAPLLAPAPAVFPAPPAPQDAEPAPSAAEGWIPLDGVAAIVNDDIVTLSQLTREVRQVRERNRLAVSTQEELERLRTEDEQLLVDIESSYSAHLSFRADPAFHVENFKIIDPQTGQEVN